MIKYTIFLATILGSTVVAYAALAPVEAPLERTGGVTVIYKNDVWPVVGELEIEYCGLEDCSDTPQS
ncbi:MAG: hypothetical protein ACKVP5_08505 [Aestuariivirga sp.]